VLISSAVATITAGVGVAIGYAIWHNKSQPTKIFCKDVKTTTNLTGYFLMLPKHLFSFVNIDSADQLIYKKDHSSLIYFVGANDINEFGMNRLGVNARDNFTLSIKTNGNIDLQGNVLYDESLSCYVVGIGNDWKMNKED
jgi:hypothetical protein